ncbi:MAG: DUF2318 domain-containing protein [Synergistaceae bacterium]|jgi:uncharacterized membrane protein|nr:DUF2318 domain-containing protein [Synergistaceae bacterium]
MLSYLIKVTNNSLSTILAMSLLLSVLYRGEPTRKKTYLGWGAAIGAAAALMYAVLKRTTGFAVREYYDLGVLLPSIVASLGLLLTLWRIFTGSKAYRFVLHFFVLCLTAGWTAYVLPDLLLYPFEFAVGMDTIFNTDFMYKVIGYLLALLVLFLVGAAYFSAASSDKLPPGLILPVLALEILVIGFFEVMTIAQILLGRNMIPRYKWLMKPLMWLLPRADGFMYVLMALAAVLCVVLFVRVKSAALEGENPAQRRKARAGAKRQLRWGATVVTGLSLALLVVTVGQSYANRAVELSPPLELPAADGKIVIPLENVNDGSLHRFVYKASDGTGVRYIVIRKSEVAYGVGLDACDVCGASGYYQRKDQVVCILCDVVMNISTIGFPGGCNPVPLKHSIKDGGIVIETSILEAEKRRFK